MNNMKITLEEFHGHTIAMQPSILLLKDSALEILDPIFETFPYLYDAINRTNKYRKYIYYTDFELFFLPAMRFCGIIDEYASIDHQVLVNTSNFSYTKP
jgi:hypothetical protein